MYPCTRCIYYLCNIALKTPSRLKTVRNWVHCGHFLSFLWVICTSQILVSHDSDYRDLYLPGSEAVNFNGSFWSKILPLCCRVCAEYGGRLLVRNVPTSLPVCQTLQSWICKYASNCNEISLFVTGCILRIHCRQRELLLTEKQGLDFQRGKRVYFSACHKVQDVSGNH
jgi:hypothetical protein